MKSRLILCFTLLTVFAIVAAAADVSGKWVAQVPGREGQTREQTFNLKADGDKLTGTISGMQGDTPIADGKVAGDDISFSVTRRFGDNEVKMLYKGKVSGAEIKFTVLREGGPGGKGPQEFTAKRVTT